LLTQGKASTHTYIHGSAVALEDRGLIFCGPSQAGKSTLAFACARRGFRVVSDDVVYLREQDQELNVWGKPWHLRFLPDYTRFFPELNRSTSALRFDGKDCFEIDVDAFLPGQTQTRCKPEAIFFLKRCGTQPRYEAVDPDEALELLSGDLVYDRPEVMERHRRFWQRLIQKGCYRLCYDERLDAAVELLKLFLEKSSGVSDAR
jgi:HPr Serine kinase C-terminal domain